MTTLQKLLGQVKTELNGVEVTYFDDSGSPSSWKEPLYFDKAELDALMEVITEALTTAYNMGQQDLIDKIRDWIEPGEDPIENWKKVLNKLQALSSKKGRR